MPLWLMQSIDRWIGVPLCFLCSCVEFVREMFVPQNDAPKRAVLIELSEMGSTILAYPAIRSVVERLGPENVFFMIFGRNREGIDLLRIIPSENVIIINDKSLKEFVTSTFKALQICWKMRIDCAIDLELFSRCTALLSWLSGATNRVGLSTFQNEGLFRGWLFNRPILYSTHHHMSETYRALTEAPFADLKDRPLLKQRLRPDGTIPRFQPSAEAREKAKSILPPNREIVVLNPDPGLLPLRAWPTESFRDLAERIAKAHPNTIVAVSGVGRAKHFADEILKNVPPSSALDLTGKTKSLEELLAILERSSVLVTIDSGPAHIGGLVDIPRIVLFGPETPVLYRPLGPKVTNLFVGLSCSPCFSAANHRTSVCRNNRCLQEIPVETVLSEVRRHLA